MTKDIDEQYMRVPAAGLAVGLTSSAVYAAMQRGILEGICEGGKWLVSRESVARYRAHRGAPTSTPRPTAAA